jgi:hypothetical protein
MKHKVSFPVKFKNTYNFYNFTNVVVVDEYPPDEIIERGKQWCKERVGSNGWNYYGKYRKVPCEFRFKNEEDLLAFKLTFGL